MKNLFPFLNSAQRCYFTYQYSSKEVLLFWAAVFPPNLKKAHFEIGDHIKKKKKKFNCVQFLRLSICTFLVLPNSLALTTYCFVNNVY